MILGRASVELQHNNATDTDTATVYSVLSQYSQNSYERFPDNLLINIQLRIR